MQFPFLNNPDTGKPDEMVTVTLIVTLAAVFRFLVDGMTLNILGHVLTFTKLDSSVYIALLGPVLGSHAFIKGKGVDNAVNNKK
jgi:hypothetical protein